MELIDNVFVKPSLVQVIFYKSLSPSRFGISSSLPKKYSQCISPKVNSICSCRLSKQYIRKEAKSSLQITFLHLSLSEFQIDKKKMCRLSMEILVWTNANFVCMKDLIYGPCQSHSKYKQIFYHLYCLLISTQNLIIRKWSPSMYIEAYILKIFTKQSLFMLNLR